MQRPDGTAEGPQAHHFQLKTAHEWLCHHTCKRHEPSHHRNSGTAVEHLHDQHHANLADLHLLPNRKRSLQIARELQAELYAAEHLPPHIYAAIWAQYKAAHDALEQPVPTLGTSSEVE
jgi:hypothetical protein